MPASAYFDHRDEQAAQVALATWKELRDEPTIGFSNNYGGFFVASRYEDVWAIARDTESFSSRATNIPQVPQVFPLINDDPPLHRPYRAIVNPLMSPTAVREQAHWIEEIIAACTARLFDHDPLDFAHEVSMPIARAVTFRLFGFQQAPDDLPRWIDQLILGVAGPEAAIAARDNLIDFLFREIQLQAGSTANTVLATLLSAEIGGAPIPTDKLIAFCILLLTAGLETTASALTSIVYYLLEHPEKHAALLEIEDGWDLAVEELIRWSTPLSIESRVAVRDVEVRGCPITSGSNVLVMWGSADRDERAFPEPDEVIFDRFPNRHLAFGIGPHRCVGSHLAKFIIRRSLERTAGELRGWEIAPGAEIRWSAAEVRRLHELPLARRPSQG